ncbi:MAG: hypothetical protein RBU37_11510 [Myxococcota bacterium]|jgi:hypothetical protein|nr:hypothetical protein [Myxococcota bacterium]
MNVSYGVGLHSVLPQDLFIVSEEPQQQIRGLVVPPRRKNKRSPSKEIRADYLKRVAAMGLCHQFCEIIEDEVAEFSFRNGNVTVRWLEPNEAATTLRVAPSIKGSMLYAALPKNLEADFYFPTFAHPQPVSTTLPELQAPCLVAALRTTARWLDSSMLEIPAMDRDFCRDLLDAVERAEALRLVLWLWYE